MKVATMGTKTVGHAFRLWTRFAPGQFLGRKLITAFDDGLLPPVLIHLSTRQVPLGIYRRNAAGGFDYEAFAEAP